MARSIILFAVLLLHLGGCAPASQQSADVRGEQDSYAYVADSPYADVLKRCVLVGTVDDSCTLSTLPLIAQRSTGTASKQAILERLLVTHDWMGERFAELLDVLPADIRVLLRAVTAIYIGSDVRPSYYSTLNGAIHLDPAYLWLSNAEKRTISTADDYRSSYGAQLQLDFYRRFVRDGQHAWDIYSLDSDVERELQAIRLPIARLLFHELAHANDFLPASRHAALDESLTVYAAVDSLREERRSTLLQSDYPLNSAALKSLAQVRYRGLDATAQDIDATAAFAGSEMEIDGGAYFYGYSTEAEELAGLFVAAMMSYHFDVEIDVAFVAKPAGSLIRGCELSVGWGRHNRLGNALVATRARYASTLILGQNSEFERFMDQLQLDPQKRETALAQGAGWCSTLLD